MTDNKGADQKWQIPSEDQLDALEILLVNNAMQFLRDHHEKHEKGMVERLENDALVSRGEQLLKNIIFVAYSMAYTQQHDDSNKIRDEAKAALKVLSQVAELLVSIPEGARARFRRHTEHGRLSIFSNDIGEKLEGAIVYFRAVSKAERGRPPDLALALATEEAVKTLEFFVGRTFIQNFASSSTTKDDPLGELTGGDSRFVEVVLKTINPLLTHTQIKTALKMHFARPE